MAFVTIPSSLIAVGKSVVQALFQNIKDNEDALNTRLTSIESVANKKVFWNGQVRGASNFTVGTNASQIRVEAGMDITDVIIAIDTTAITSGTLEIDILKATGTGNGPNFTTSVSIFTTKPSIDFSTVSNYDDSTDHTAAVISVTNGAIVEGDWLQLNVSSKPASLGRFSFYAIGEAS